MTAVLSSFTDADFEALSGPHVHRTWFITVTLPTSGVRRYHLGINPVTIDGNTFEGVNDPFGGQVVQLTGVQEARFGTTPRLTAVISGANKEWLRQLRDEGVEGSPVRIEFATFDAETGEIIIPPRLMFIGRVTAPRFQFAGLGVRVLNASIVSQDEGLGYPATKTEWSPAGFRARNAGDRGGDQISSDVIEDFRA